jgi:hypothetical protein
VPLALSIRVVLGGLLSQIGWAVAGFGLIFVWVFDAGGALGSAVAFAGELATVEGVTSAWRQTQISINDEAVFETSYEFELEGRRVTGASYVTGSYMPQGEPVTVEYVASDPTLSRIRGMRASVAGVGISFVFTIPLVGLALAAVGTGRGLRARRLLATGHLALGTLKSKEPTNSTVNNQPVYRLTFEFPAARGGTYEVTSMTHRAFELEDEPAERLVYDPRHPNDAALLDELPCRPAIDARGDFAVGGSGQRIRAILNLVIPGLTVLAFVAYALFAD